MGESFEDWLSRARKASRRLKAKERKERLRARRARAEETKRRKENAEHDLEKRAQQCRAEVEKRRRDRVEAAQREAARAADLEKRAQQCRAVHLKWRRKKWAQEKKERKIDRIVVMLEQLRQDQLRTLKWKSNSAVLAYSASGTMAKDARQLRIDYAKALLNSVPVRSSFNTAATPAISFPHDKTAPPPPPGDPPSSASPNDSSDDGIKGGDTVALRALSARGIKHK